MKFVDGAVCKIDLMVVLVWVIVKKEEVTEVLDACDTRDVYDK